MARLAIHAALLHLVKKARPVFQVPMHLGDPRGGGKIHQRYQALRETKNLFVNYVDAPGNLPESNDMHGAARRDASRKALGSD